MRELQYPSLGRKFRSERFAEGRKRIAVGERSVLLSADVPGIQLAPNEIASGRGRAAIKSR
jgi:hypothetical protein